MFSGGDSCDHNELMKCMFDGAADVLKRNGIADRDALVQVMNTAAGPEDVSATISLMKY